MHLYVYIKIYTHTVCTIIYLLFLKKTVQLKSVNFNSASKIHLLNCSSLTIFLLLFTVAYSTTTASINTYLQRLYFPKWPVFLFLSLPFCTYCKCKPMTLQWVALNNLFLSLHAAEEMAKGRKAKRIINSYHQIQLVSQFFNLKALCKMGQLAQTSAVTFSRQEDTVHM